MISITFQATSMENLVRQLTAFVEKVDLEQKGVKKRGRREKGEAASGSDGDMG